ncbi:response regulator [Streptomyces sp. NPDC006274]|uniref:response regulator transcription factor n=1 Tax=unclassified Streptomyces TaxID=2593676 RepID=UPI0033B7896D
MLLADDHALVRRGVRLILDGEPDLRVVAEAGDGAEAIAMARAHAVDLAVLDIAMPAPYDIAETPVISVKTVQRHRANPLRKPGLRDRLELTRYAIRAGLAGP